MGHIHLGVLPRTSALVKLRLFAENLTKDIYRELRLTPDDLSVIYVESSVKGVRFRPLRVSPDGDFVDRWPHGFFAERAEELF